MNEKWFVGHKGEKREQRKQRVLSHATAFEDLTEVLTTHFKKREAVRDYENPGWVHKQIAVNEYNQAITDIINLINLDPKE